MHHQLTPRHFKASILVVDDMEFNRIIICDVLERAGFINVFQACDGMDALRIMNERAIDTVILDIAMPRMDGFGFCKEMQARNLTKHIPILVQTALHDADERLDIFMAGAADLLLKPINPKELILRLTLHLSYAFSMNDLEDYKRKMEDEMQLAQATQHALLPENEDVSMLRATHGCTIASHYAPSLKIGGDLWGACAINDHKVALFAFDIAGHGITSAMHAFRLHTLINLELLLDLTPGEYMQEINVRTAHMFNPGQFATCFIGVIDTSANELIYSSAAFTAPIRYHAQTQKSAPLEHRGLPIGIEQKAVYETYHHPLLPSDSLLLYSDALTETALLACPERTLTENDIGDIMHRHLSAKTGCNENQKAAIQELLHVIGAADIAHPEMDDLMMVLISR